MDVLPHLISGLTGGVLRMLRKIARIVQSVGNPVTCVTLSTAVRREASDPGGILDCNDLLNNISTLTRYESLNLENHSSYASVSQVNIVVI